MGNETVRVARNTFYASVGFGVLAFQKVQVRRRELERAIKPQVDAVHRQLRNVTGHPAPPEPPARPTSTAGATPSGRRGASPAA